VGQPAVCAKAGIIRLWFRDARTLYWQFWPYREQAHAYRGTHSKCRSEPARDSNPSDTTESGTNKNGSLTGLPLLIYR
jgi:hypothetical protein